MVHRFSIAAGHSWPLEIVCTLQGEGEYREVIQPGTMVLALLQVLNCDVDLVVRTKREIAVWALDRAMRRVGRGSGLGTGTR